jgi:protein O-GlcNAc transferase
MQTDLSTIDPNTSNLLFLDQFSEAIELCLSILATNPYNLYIKFQLGLALLLAGQEEDAQGVWLETLLENETDEISQTKKLEKFLEQEALQRLNFNKITQAELIIYYLLEINDFNEWAYEQLGNIFVIQNKIEDAINSYKRSLSINQDSQESIEVILKLGFLCKEQDRIDEAEKYYILVASKGYYLENSFYNLSQIYELKNEKLKADFYNALYLAINGQYQKSSEKLKALVDSEYQTERLYWTLFECYRRIGENSKALECIERGLRVYPENSTIFIKNKLAVPLLYDNEDEIDFYRERFNKGLDELIQGTELDTPEKTKQALDALDRHNNFFLAYQGRNDLCLQEKYGLYVHQVMKSNFPDLAERNFNRSSGNKIKIAYISSFFRGHTVCKLFKGWIEFADKDSFEIFSYHLDNSCDEYTKEIKKNSDYFYHFPSGFEEICRNILDHEIDILVYPEIGMDFRTMKLAALRLAPIQCMAWGHPVTSGLPTIDYFLSSKLMETGKSNQHYHEELICLSNLSISYKMPELPTQPFTREDFGIEQDSVVYFSCQSTFKYLPQYDHIFALIAQKVPKAKFIFIATHSQDLTEKFITRVSRSFSKYGLSSDDYCIVVPKQDTRGYFSLNLLADIFLDTLDWSGGNTTLEALACNLPVVTCPGQFMRGRHAYAMLNRIGINDTIADSLSDYVDISVQLGTNQDYKKRIIHEIKEKKHLIFNEMSSISDLEKFYKKSMNTITKSDF